MPKKLFRPVPKCWPISQLFGVNPKVYARFGLKGHNGLDFSCFNNTPIRACDSGKVCGITMSPTQGNGIRLEHKWGVSVHWHIKGPTVRRGLKVKRGQIIALSDNTGFSTGPHLHFEIRPNGVSKNNGYNGAVNPFKYF